MTGEVVPNDGREWVMDRALGQSNLEPDTVAVGTGTTDPTLGDSAVESEVFRASSDSSVVTVEPGDELATIEAIITVSGGTEIPSGTDVSELALLATDGPNNEVLVYREVRSVVTVASGRRVQFSFTVELTA